MEDQSIITLTPEALASIITEAVARGVEAALTQPKQKSANAERCARYRQKKAETQESMSKPCQSMSQHGRDMETTCKPSPSPLSPRPPFPTPPPERESAPARKGVKSQSSNALAKAEAEQANAEPVPLMLQTPEFVAAWKLWCDWRTRCALIGTNGKKHPWTPHRAKLCLTKCEKWGSATAAAAIENSVDRWLDIYETKDENSQHSPNHQTASRSASSGNGKNSGGLNTPGRYDN